GKYVVNPTMLEMQDSELDLVVAGTTEGVLMVESEASELNEDIMLSAVMEGWKAFQPVIEGSIGLAEMCAKDPWDVPEVTDAIKKLGESLKKDYEKELSKAYSIKAKQERSDAISKLRDEATEKYLDEENGITAQV